MAALLVAGCVPSGGGGPYTSDNDKPIPGVVGVEVDRACRTIGDTGHVAEVSAVTEAADLEPGRVVAQDPKPRSKPGKSMIVGLTVSGPFAEEELPPDTACVNSGEGH